MIEQIERPQGAEGDTRRMLDRRRASRKRNIGEVGEAFKSAAVGEHDLAAPQSTVEAVAGAIEGNAANGFIEVVFPITERICAW